MTNHGQTFLKVTSILMIVGGIIAAIAGVLAILGVSTLAMLVGSTEGTGLLYASSIIVTVTSVVEIIAGIKGLMACKNPVKAGGCMILGIVVAVLSIVSMAVNMAGGGSFKISSLILNLLVPVLYLFGVIKTKS